MAGRHTGLPLLTRLAEVVRRYRPSVIADHRLGGVRHTSKPSGRDARRPRVDQPRATGARHAALSIDVREHVRVARLAGLVALVGVRRHHLPLVAPALLVTWSENWSRDPGDLGPGFFLPVGVPPPQPEWGAMLADGRSYMGAAPGDVRAGLAVVLKVLSINLFGDWLRDQLALDGTGGFDGTPGGSGSAITRAGLTSARPRSR